MKKLQLLLFFFFSISRLSAQDTMLNSILKKYNFKEYQVKSGGDTVFFYVNDKGAVPGSNMVLYLSGSTPDPLFTYEMKEGKRVSYFWGHQDYKLLPEGYIYVVIAKKGMHGAFDEAVKMGTPASYLEKNSLDYRVWQADKVINYCYKHLLSKPGKMIVYGHSEGFNVVAKLLTVNKKITHAGLWAGSAMPDYFDFAMFNRISYMKGEMSDSACNKQMDTLFSNYRNIFDGTAKENPSSIYTNKRWKSYAEPSVNHLLKVNIPLYMVAASKDDNAPVESSYIVPLEFTRLGKKNLTYTTCVGCNHSFNVTQPDGSRVSYWNSIFTDFINWTNR